MTTARRTVVVGERLRPGYTMDDAMRRVETLVPGAPLCLAVLNRSDGTTVLAVTLEGDPSEVVTHHGLLAAEMAAIFGEVSLVESASTALAAIAGLP